MDISSQFQIESCRTELTNKDNEITGLKMKADTLQNQQSEHQHYINVLKDQITAKEQQSSMFQADVSLLRGLVRLILSFGLTEETRNTTFIQL